MAKQTVRDLDVKGYSIKKGIYQEEHSRTSASMRGIKIPAANPGAFFTERSYCLHFYKKLYAILISN